MPTFSACGAPHPGCDDELDGAKCHCLLTDCIGSHRCACGHEWQGEPPAGNEVSRQLHAFAEYLNAKGAALQVIADSGGRDAANALPTYRAVAGRVIPELRRAACEIERLCGVADRAEAREREALAALTELAPERRQ